LGGGLREPVQKFLSGKDVATVNADRAVDCTNVFRLTSDLEALFSAIRASERFQIIHWSAPFSAGPRLQLSKTSNRVCGAELEKDAAKAAKDAEAERSKLQAALDQANAEIERLKTELQQEEALPPQEGDLASQPPV